jgi:hypothetical protein
MHGLGDTPAGFTDLFGSIEYSPFLKSTRVVLPCAPIRKVTINFGMESTSWFDIKDF